MTALASVDVHPLIVDLTTGALGRVDAIAMALVERAWADEPEFADAGVPIEDTRAASAHLLTSVFRHIADGTPLDLTAVRALGRGWAEQGLPLPALLHALRIGFQFVWEDLLGQLRTDDVEALTVVLSHVDPLWCVLDAYSRQLRLGYAETVNLRAQLAEARRNAHLDTLLTTDPVDSSHLSAGAAALDLPHTGYFHVAVTQGMVTAEREDWSAHMAQHGITAVWRERPDETVGLFSATQPGDLPALRDPRSRIGISPGYADIGDTGVAVRRARTAAASLPQGTTGLSRYGQEPTACLVAGSPVDAAELTRLLLGPVLDLPSADASVLLDTLVAWFGAAGSSAVAATMLNCHQNTVRYRIRRIEKVTGRSMSDPRSVGDFHVAVWSLVQQGLVTPPSS